MKGFDRVLVSVDFSSASRLAVQLAQSIVSANGVVYAIHVIPNIVSDAKVYIKDSGAKALQDRISKEAIYKLSKWTDKIVTGKSNVEYVIGAGDPASEIIKASKSKGAHIIVMGVHGKKRSDLGIMGSTVDKVIRISDCPVICVPPERV